MLSRSSEEDGLPAEDRPSGEVNGKGLLLIPFFVSLFFGTYFAELVTCFQCFIFRLEDLGATFAVIIPAS